MKFLLVSLFIVATAIQYCAACEQKDANFLITKYADNSCCAKQCRQQSCESPCCYNPCPPERLYAYCDPCLYPPIYQAQCCPSYQVSPCSPCCYQPAPTFCNVPYPTYQYSPVSYSQTQPPPACCQISPCCPQPCCTPSYSSYSSCEPTYRYARCPSCYSCCNK